jgi:hypothetical protein
LNNTELTTASIANYVSISRREVVEILILPISCVEELEDLVAFDVYWLNVDELVVWPLIGIRIRGTVFGERVAAIAVTYFTKQDITDKRCGEDLAVLPIGSLR